jgi:hypothetical protein
MWQKDPGEKMSYDEAVMGVEDFDLSGYDDWRIPTIKELYSLILFNGTDPSGPEAMDPIPFIDTDYFDFKYGDESAGARIIDSQYISSTEYVGMNSINELVFGVNFADGRIKGYGTGPMPGQSEDKKFYVIYVRGNTGYGINDFINNNDDTITDFATGLIWSREDFGEFNWKEALSFVQQKNAENYLGHDDWRLPDTKELQSIVDYNRSPDSTGSAAIDPVFSSTMIINEYGIDDFPFYWTGTTHVNSIMGGSNAVYISFGRALGYMRDSWIDIHGAGTQRSDPKIGDPADYPEGHGPQGDAIRIYNYIRLVRNSG